ncbi:MAG TPA: SDR family oxidoreductase [Ktedonobacteraceae bacterium]|nr:SDR family oxidoreductase [Ktedonobacteraceae bacterium]
MALTNFEGAVAVITGGASGIGFATAKALRSKGAHVVLADINSQGLQQAEEQLRQQQPATTRAGGILTMVTDVTNEEQVEELMRQTSTNFGRIDLVVTSAGIGAGGPIDSFSVSQMQTLMNINFMGTYICTHAALPYMRQQGAGHFVFLSSVAGKLGVPFLSGYCASKWAVRGFASALRAEWYNSGLGITTVYPDWVDTPMVQKEGEVAQIMGVQVLLTPDQVASEILQAVADGRPDLTLAPTQATSLGLQLYKEDPDKAEQLMGASFYERIARLSSNQD